MLRLPQYPKENMTDRKAEQNWTKNAYCKEKQIKMITSIKEFANFYSLFKKEKKNGNILMDQIYSEIMSMQLDLQKNKNHRILTST